MATPTIKQQLKAEMQSIRREYGRECVESWDERGIEDMDSNEAFDRGYYRGLQLAIGYLN